MDKAERAGTPLHVILLDWEKAFDKITHSSLFKTLERFDIDPHLINLVKGLYNNPTFTVTEHGKHRTPTDRTPESDKDVPCHRTYS